MDYSSTESFITNIIEILRAAGEKQFMLSFEFRARKGNTELPIRYINLLVDTRSNYIGIWIDDSGKTIFELSGEDFKFQSCHDSCWRTDGMRWIFKNYIDMRDKLMTLEKGLSTAEANQAVSMSPYWLFKREVSFETERVDFGVKVKNFKLK